MQKKKKAETKSYCSNFWEIFWIAGYNKEDGSSYPRLHFRFLILFDFTFIS
jgi:hypothetical protein